MAFENGIGEAPVVLSGIGGLNSVLHMADIGETELAIAYNFWFEASSGKLTTRSGIATVSTNTTGATIELLYSFIRKDTLGWIVAVSDSKLFFFNAATLEWSFLADLESDLPSLQSFNGTLYIADGSLQGIMKWDGTKAPGRLEGSPAATALYVIQNRLIANSIEDTELDAVYMSGPETDSFETTTDGALILRIGYGDGQQVNGFSNISKTLIVSKVGYVAGKATKKAFYGINMADPDPGNWIADSVSQNNAATGPHALVGVAQDIIYIDTQGVESLGPTQEYGDIATDPVTGGKVNNILAPLARQAGNRAKLVQISNLATTIIILGTKVYTLSNLTKGFTELSFETPIRTALNFGDDVYLAGDSGYLYKLANIGRDEIAPGVFRDYSAKLRFKMTTSHGEILLTKSNIDIQYVYSGTYKITAVAGNKTNATILQVVDFIVPTGSEYLYDAEGELSDANYDLGSVGSQERIPCRAKYRGDGIALEITTSKGGRVSVGKLILTFANVGK